MTAARPPPLSATRSNRTNRAAASVLPRLLLPLAPAAAARGTLIMLMLMPRLEAGMLHPVHHPAAVRRHSPSLFAPSALANFTLPARWQARGRTSQCSKQ